MIAALASAVLLLMPTGPLAREVSGVVVRPVASLASGHQGRWAGELANVAPSPDGLRLVGDGDLRRGSARAGFFIAPVEAVHEPFDRVRAALEVGSGPGTVELDVRTSLDGLAWSSWTAAPADGTAVAVPAGRFVQYRAELVAAGGGRPLLKEVRVDLASTGAAPLEASGENPTVRVFATREGLVGRKTANGHTIVERDRFAALPSKRALNSPGKRDYQVRVTYKGKSATVPIWDVGPWNTKDNYWDAEREIFGDLPRFVPQAYAAWRNDYNNGRDQFNRWVSFPASIDLADGTFIEDLGMRNSDWVDVTFLWVKASSPGTDDMPKVTGLKPEPKAPAPAPPGHSWFFAEGITKRPFETWFVLYNPGDEPARANLTFSQLGGGLHRQEVVVEPNARVAVFANEAVPDAEFVTRIDSSQPVLAERSTYFAVDGHSSSGVTTPATTWYLAEGSSQRPFDSWLLVHNPGAETANVSLIFMKDNGENRTLSLTVPPVTRREVRASEVVPETTFATKIVSDEPVVVERTVYLAGGGGHSATASPVTSKAWYLAEGSTLDSFDTWVLLQNPNRAAATVRLTFLREQGPPVEERVVVGATARLAFNARQVLVGERFGLKLEADQPIVAERAMYFGGRPDGGGTGAHASVAAPEPARSWYLPEGSTRSPFEEQVLLANPGSGPARVRLEFVREDRGVVTREVEVPGLRRLTVHVNAEVPDAAVVTHVTADQPIVVERSIYFNGSGGTNALGMRR